MHKSASALVAEITAHIGDNPKPTPAQDTTYLQLVLERMQVKALTQPNIVICLRELYAIGCFRVALKYP